MLVKLNCMFLGYREGKLEDGRSYYQGQFLETGSNNVFRLYFPDDSKLKTFKPYSQYSLDCDLYLNTKGLWAIKVVQ